MFSISSHADIDCTTDRDCKYKYCHNLALENGLVISSAEYQSFMDECQYWEIEE